MNENKAIVRDIMSFGSGDSSRLVDQVRSGGRHAQDGCRGERARGPHVAKTDPLAMPAERAPIEAHDE
jgi:hypothetical protein